MWVNVPGLTAVMVVSSLCGAVVYAQYADCDPVKSNKIDANDQVRSVTNVKLFV